MVAEKFTALKDTIQKGYEQMAEMQELLEAEPILTGTKAKKKEVASKLLKPDSKGLHIQFLFHPQNHQHSFLLL